MKKRGFIVNGPPSDERCYTCRRHVDEIDPVEENPDDELSFLTTEFWYKLRLIKSFREDAPGMSVGAYWLCPDCVGKPIE